LAVLGLVLSGLGPVAAQQEKGVTVAEIRKAWQARQDKVRSARFAWTERQTFSKGFRSFALSQLGPFQAKLNNPEGKTIPPQDTTFEVPVTLRFDGNKVRYKYEDKRWSLKENTYIPDPYDLASDGAGVDKDLHATGSSRSSNPSGGVTPNAMRLSADEPRLRALLCAVRGTSPALRPIVLDAYTPTHQKVVIRGRPCIEMEVRWPQGNTRIWLDRARDYVLVRQEVVLQREVVQKLDVDYRADDVAGWIPASWEAVTRIGGGKYQHAIQASLGSYQLNASIDKKEFDLRFPPGAFVMDVKAKQRYLLRPDGRKRIITPREASLPYETLLATDTGELTGERNSRKTWVWMGCLAGSLVVAVGGYWLWKRTHRQYGRP
jgi:hypothetical protein